MDFFDGDIIEKTEWGSLLLSTVKLYGSRTSSTETLGRCNRISSKSNTDCSKTQN